MSETRETTCLICGGLHPWEDCLIERSGWKSPKRPVPIRKAATAVIEEFTVPPKSGKSGWYPVPLWVARARIAIGYPRDGYTLPNGEIALPGDTIVKSDSGALSIKRAP